MTDVQTARFAMHRTVLATLDAHPGARTAAPVLQAHRDALDALVARVREASQRQAEPTSAVTAVKRELRDAVRDRSRRLGQAIAAHAAAQGLPDARARVLIGANEHAALADPDLAEYSEIVVAEAREHLPAPDADPSSGLGAYGVTAPFVDALDALDDEYAEDIATPRSAIAARKGAGRAIATAVRQAQRLLRKESDPLVDFLAPDHPAFAQAYRDARIIVDRGRTGRTDEPTDGET